MEKTLNNLFNNSLKVAKIFAKYKKENDKLFKKQSAIAYELQKTFFERNQNLFTDEKYYYLHIEDQSLLVEESRFIKYNNSYAEFAHTSPNRQNHIIYLELSISIEEYSSNSAMVDKIQLDELAQFCKINIRD